MVPREREPAIRLLVATALLLGAWGGLCDASETPEAIVPLTDARCGPGPTAGSQELQVEVDRRLHPSRLLVFCRVSGRGSYRTQEMEDAGAGLFRTTLLHIGSDTESVECHFALLDDNGAVTQVGSSLEPMRLGVSREEAPPLSFLVLSGAGAVSLLPLLAGASLLVRLRRARLCSQDTAYWHRKLGGLAHLSGPELSRCIGEMSRAPLPHPRYGAIRWRRAFLYEKLRQVKAHARPPGARPAPAPSGEAGARPRREAPASRVPGRGTPPARFRPAP